MGSKDSQHDPERGKEVLREERDTIGWAHLRDSADAAKDIQGSEPEDWQQR